MKKNLKRILCLVVSTSMLLSSVLVQAETIYEDSMETIQSPENLQSEEASATNLEQNAMDQSSEDFEDGDINNESSADSGSISSNNNENVEEDYSNIEPSLGNVSINARDVIANPNSAGNAWTADFSGTVDFEIVGISSDERMFIFDNLDNEDYSFRDDILENLNSEIHSYNIEIANGVGTIKDIAFETDVYELLETWLGGTSDCVSIPFSENVIFTGSSSNVFHFFHGDISLYEVTVNCVKNPQNLNFIQNGECRVDSSVSYVPSVVPAGTVTYKAFDKNGCELTEEKLEARYGISIINELNPSETDLNKLLYFSVSFSKAFKEDITIQITAAGNEYYDEKVVPIVITEVIKASFKPVVTVPQEWNRTKNLEITYQINPLVETSLKRINASLYVDFYAREIGKGEESDILLGRKEMRSFVPQSTYKYTVGDEKYSLETGKKYYIIAKLGSNNEYVNSNYDLATNGVSISSGTVEPKLAEANCVSELNLSYEYGKTIKIQLGDNTEQNDDEYIFAVKDGNNIISDDFEIVSITSNQPDVVYVNEDEKQLSVISACASCDAQDWVTVTISLKDRKEYPTYADKNIILHINATPSKSKECRIVNEKNEVIDAVSIVNEQDQKVYDWYGENVKVVYTDITHGYTGIRYRIQGETEWCDEQLVITEGDTNVYEICFYSDIDERLDSYRAFGEEGICTYSNIRVDTSAPDLSGAKTEIVSETNHISGNQYYFVSGNKVVIKISDVENDATGFSSMKMKYTDEDGYERSVRLYKSDMEENSYLAELTQDGKYKNIAFEFTDGVNHNSTYSFDKNIIVSNSIFSSDFQIYKVNGNNRELVNSQNFGDMPVSGEYEFVFTVDDSTDDGYIYAVKYWLTNIETGSMNIEESILELKEDVSTPGKYVGRITFGSEQECLYHGMLNFQFEKYIDRTHFDSKSAYIVSDEPFTQKIYICNSKIQKPKINMSISPSKRSEAGDTYWYNASQKDENIYTFFAAPLRAKGGKPGYFLHYEVFRQGDGSAKTVSFEIGYDYFGNPIASVNGGEFKSIESVEDYLQFPFEEDGLYEITAYCRDCAYKRTEAVYLNVIIDTTGPSNLCIYYNSVNETTESADELTTYQLFYNTDLVVTASAQTGCSGLASAYMKEFDSMESAQQWADLEDWENSSYDLSSDYVIAEEKRAIMALCVIDNAGNKKMVFAKPFVLDKTPVSISEFIDEEANEFGFYNKSTKVKFTATDKPEMIYSGLSSVSYQIIVDGHENEKVEIFSNEENAYAGFMESKEFEIELDADAYEGNEVRLLVDAVDMAGNKLGIPKEKVYKIDKTAPYVEITYDKKFDEKDFYLNSAITATVTVTEKNFDPALFNLVVSKDGKEYPILLEENAWSSDEEYHHTVHYTFKEDGEYVVTAKLTDMADNESEYDKIDKFVIDQTEPAVKVTYNNNHVSNEKYYNASRTATITVTETNFDEKLFEIDLNSSAVVTESNWVSNGIEHIKTLNFSEDGSFEYKIIGKDLAGNECEDYVQEEFIIDTKKPYLEITGVENNSANSKDVNPVVSTQDDNFYDEGVEIRLINSKNQEIDLETIVQDNMKGKIYILDNVNTQRDEIYTLYVSIIDMAGNEASDRYRFSLNRNGSTYDLSDMSYVTEKRYIKYSDMTDLNIYEMNIDQIESFTMYMSRNGQMLMNVVKGNRPVTPDKNTIYYKSTESGNENIGYQFHYTVYRENFEEEGVYNLTFYSRDRAGNEVNSTLTDKGAEIIFAIDNTAPEVIVNGVTPGEYFTPNGTPVNVIVEDNFKLDSAMFYLVDVDGNVLEMYDYLEMVEEEGDILSLTFEAGYDYVSLLYTCTDKAGNELQLLSEKFVQPDSEGNSENNENIFIDEEDVPASSVIPIIDDKRGKIYLLWLSLAIIVSGTGAFWAAKRHKHK